MYVLTELGYVLICHIKEKKKKKCSFENALVEKSESSTRNKNGLVEGLLLFSIQMFTFTDLSRSIILSLYKIHQLNFTMYILPILTCTLSTYVIRLHKSNFNERILYYKRS